MTCNALRLCIESGLTEVRCKRHHDGLGCTTGLYRLDGGVVSPVDEAVTHVIERSPTIRTDMERGAYTDDLVRHVLVEALRTGAVQLTERT